MVWIFDPKDQDLVTNPDKESPFDCTRTKVFLPRHITVRIRAQSGAFTVHKYLPNREEFVAFEHNIHYNTRLIKVVIPAECFRSLRFDLDRYGVNEFSLFPDIDGLCRHQTWLNSRLDDELGSG